MDPNQTLHELRTLAIAIADEGDDDRQRTFATLFQALDEWLSTGGFAPEDWEHE